MTTECRRPLEGLLTRAAAIAARQRAASTGTKHLLLAIMLDRGSPWARILEERGVGTLEDAARVTGPVPTNRHRPHWALTRLSLERLSSAVTPSATAMS